MIETVTYLGITIFEIEHFKQHNSIKNIGIFYFKSNGNLISTDLYIDSDLKGLIDFKEV